MDQVKCQKMRAIAKAPADAEKDIDLINQHTLKELKPEDVFVFSVVLCDNDVDRDFEQFADSMLDDLAPLFVGKTGIFNHSWDAHDQIARVYKTDVEAGGVNSQGQPMKQLKAFAYILRNESTFDVIGKIEGGILKEVSVGVTAGQCMCSVCGAPMGWRSCSEGHDKGMKYEDRLCYGIHASAVDAYEFSFVAVPAQRGAGVTKGADGDAVDKILATALTLEQAHALIAHCQKSLQTEDEQKERESIKRRAEERVKLFGGN